MGTRKGSRKGSWSGGWPHGMACSELQASWVAWTVLACRARLGVHSAQPLAGVALARETIEVE